MKSSMIHTLYPPTHIPKCQPVRHRRPVLLDWRNYNSGEITKGSNNMKQLRLPHHPFKMYFDKRALSLQKSSREMYAEKEEHYTLK